MLHKLINGIKSKPLAKIIAHWKGNGKSKLLQQRNKLSIRLTNNWPIV